jgi:allantoinase
VDITCETCPHYLVLCDEDVEALGAVTKCAPPLRPAVEREALWDHLAAGRVPVVASDHSPAPAGMKEGADFFTIWGGISGCQSTLPLLLTEGHARRGIDLPLIAQVTSRAVARRFGLWPAKGSLEAGADADLALVDLGQRWRLEADELLYRHRHSPYVGRTLRGRVVRTLIRGATVYRDGRIAGRATGRLLVPQTAPRR